MERGRGGIALFNKLLGYEYVEPSRQYAQRQSILESERDFKDSMKVISQTVLGVTFRVGYEKEDGDGRVGWSNGNWQAYKYAIQINQGNGNLSSIFRGRSIFPRVLEDNYSVDIVPLYIMGLTAWRTDLYQTIAEWQGDKGTKLASMVISANSVSGYKIEAGVLSDERFDYLGKFWDNEYGSYQAESNWWRASVDLGALYFQRDLVKSSMQIRHINAIKYRIDAGFKDYLSIIRR